MKNGTVRLLWEGKTDQTAHFVQSGPSLLLTRFLRIHQFQIKTQKPLIKWHRWPFWSMYLGCPHVVESTFILVSAQLYWSIIRNLSAIWSTVTWSSMLNILKKDPPSFLIIFRILIVYLLKWATSKRPFGSAASEDPSSCTVVLSYNLFMIHCRRIPKNFWLHE